MHRYMYLGKPEGTFKKKKCILLESIGEKESQGACKHWNFTMDFSLSHASVP
jgi:hypothetical protein